MDNTQQNPEFEEWVSRCYKALFAADFASFKESLHREVDTNPQQRAEVMKGYLCEAVAQHMPECIAYLLDMGVPVDARIDRANSALQVAALYGYNDIVRQLLAAGADVNHRTCEYCFPLESAARYGRLETMQLLLDAGADVTMADSFALFAACEATEQSTMSIEQVCPVVEFLLNAGASPDATCYNKNWSALAEVLSVKDNATAQLLLERGCTHLHDGVSWGLHSDDDEFPIETGPKDILPLLLERGLVASDILYTENNFTVFMEAAFNGSLDNVKLLLSHGVDLNAVTTDDPPETALDLAIRADNFAIAEFLRSRGALLAKELKN